MIRSLTREFRNSDKKVGIVAIDPSSPFSGGAILGDRIRMGEFAGDENVFIRSMATRGWLGGLTRGCMEAVDILDAAGFDIILIETVGVGQDEVDIAQAALSIIVVSAPGLGDGIQAIKAGILEIADIHVVSKCDLDYAHQTITELKSLINLRRLGRKRHGWEIPVIETSSSTGQGIEKLTSNLKDHLHHLEVTKELELRLVEIYQMRVIKAAEEIARQQIKEKKHVYLDPNELELKSELVDPYDMAKQIIVKNQT